MRVTRVSVLMPVRDGLPYLHEALGSILTQSFSDFELIVIYDGSTDGSGDVVRAAADPRVTLIRTRGIGVAAALNTGLRVARGEFVARQDADDVSGADRFAKQVQYLDSHPDVGVVSSRVRFIDAHGADIETDWTRAVRGQWEPAVTPEAIARLMPQTCCVIHGTVMVRREALVECGGYRAELPVAQDYDLWLRLLPRARFARLPDRLYSFRIHGAQVSATRGREQARHAIAAKLRYVTATTPLPPTVRTFIAGTGTGAGLYRDAIREAGWTEVAGPGDSDVTVFTEFATLDEDVRALVAGESRDMTRVGNFLIARSTAL